ncbi:MAG: glycoside hydrolase family 2 protein [Ignavibacteriales bacterium]|nr:glycoside hydrolase family 2 protein [Ignavibacteriales bacterium]
MKVSTKFYTIFFVLFLLIFVNIQVNASYIDKNNKRILFDFNWKFQLGDVQNAETNEVNDDNWRDLDLPHDWSIEGEISEDAPAGGNGGYFPTGIGWYRKHFDIIKEDLNKIIWIEFDGVYMNSDVWINGNHLGNYPFGYSSFYYDITPYLKAGENIIAVKVDNSQQPNSRWYSGSGIYRNVWLIKQDPLHIAHWGVYVTTPEVSKESAVIEIKTKIDNENKSLQNGKLRSVLLDSKGNQVAKNEIGFSIDSEKTQELNQQIKINSPSLWSVNSPTLYKLHQTIVNENNEVDSQTTIIGIRKIEYDVNKGFFLNDEHIKMNGVCLHHDGGSVGAAVPIGIWKYRLEKLKKMGCNAIRTSHNPPAPEFLDLCDEMGFLVMDESFDEWKIGKRKYAYNMYFDEWNKTDLIAMLHRDRNHPSIVLWSVGNEIPDQKTEEGAKTLKALTDICHEEDPTRPVTSACDNIAADGGATTLEFLNALDIVGYNYVDRWHERQELYFSIDRHEHPNWKMIGTENGSNHGNNRGSYSLGDDLNSVKPDYNYNMINSEQLWKFVKIHDYVIGDFMWTGIDYLGESRWPGISRSFAPLDLCGFPKDGFYFYQSQWTAEPMLHLFPHWNWEGREGQIIPVLCYTNCNEVELFVNGKSYGEKRIEFPRQGHSGAWNKFDNPVVNPTTADLHLQWDIPYSPGTLKAVGKVNGKIVSTFEIKTTGNPSKLKLLPDSDTLLIDERGVANVRVEILDSQGNIVPTADNLVTFLIEGEGKIIGVGNGDPNDHMSFKLSERKAFNGLCQVVIQSTQKSGKIKLTAKSNKLKEAHLDLYSH